MIVATLNVWGRNAHWPARLDLIRKRLAELRPDVIGLQEVWRHDGRCEAEEIAGGLGYEIAYAPAFVADDGRIQGNAILSRLPLTGQRVTPLPTHGFEPRALLFAMAGDLPVFVTHLNWEPDHSHIRQEQVRFITAQMAAHPGAVLLGDFNAGPDSPEIAHLGGVLTDAWAAAGDGGPGHTFDRANGYVLAADEPTTRLDYIFTPEPPTRTWLTFTEPELVDGTRIWPSDHYGLACELAR
ncbi:endonuclease/exonuclease/phosphatase family protein [Nonomuraea sp. NBC_01738]|uniref:endonuclease/exonuclease/phosphatase family protein n=1 Tax=Nonomuraea sp. NBC_01738 TaxID=2976003 RepID=UPI002E164416|nr:endonuclease/exonuclease/phosphatase family protein [Nonomuraea sp. NBC_01738]